MAAAEISAPGWLWLWKAAVLDGCSRDQRTCLIVTERAASLADCSIESYKCSYNECRVVHYTKPPGTFMCLQNRVGVYF